MVTTHTTSTQKITLGQSCLQAFWADSANNNNPVVRDFSDKRLSVVYPGCVTKTIDTVPVRGPGRRRRARKSSPSDSLLGSLLAESFFGAVFGPLLPVWAQAVDWSNVAEAADTVWLDRRHAAPAMRPRALIFGIF